MTTRLLRRCSFVMLKRFEEYNCFIKTLFACISFVPVF